MAKRPDLTLSKAPREPEDKQSPRQLAEALLVLTGGAAGPLSAKLLIGRVLTIGLARLFADLSDVTPQRRAIQNFGGAIDELMRMAAEEDAACRR